MKTRTLRILMDDLMSYNRQQPSNSSYPAAASAEEVEVITVIQADGDTFIGHLIAGCFLLGFGCFFMGLTIHRLLQISSKLKKHQYQHQLQQQDDDDDDIDDVEKENNEEFNDLLLIIKNKDDDYMKDDDNINEMMRRNVVLSGSKNNGEESLLFLSDNTEVDNDDDVDDDDEFNDDDDDHRLTRISRIYCYQYLPEGKSSNNELILLQTSIALIISTIFGLLLESVGGIYINYNDHPDYTLFSYALHEIVTLLFFMVGITGLFEYYGRLPKDSIRFALVIAFGCESILWYIHATTKLDITTSMIHKLLSLLAISTSITILISILLSSSSSSYPPRSSSSSSSSSNNKNSSYNKNNKRRTRNQHNNPKFSYYDRRRHHHLRSLLLYSLSNIIVDNSYIKFDINNMARIMVYCSRETFTNTIPTTRSCTRFIYITRDYIMVDYTNYILLLVVIDNNNNILLYKLRVCLL